MLSEYNLEVLTFDFQLLLFNYVFQSSEVRIYSEGWISEVENTEKCGGLN